MQIRILLAAFLLLGPLSSHAQPWKPTHGIEIIVGSAPGGGADLTGRLMQKLFQEKLITDVATSVVNKTGGGSTLSFVYLNQHPGDAHYIALSLQPMITGPLMIAGQLPYTDMTPLAHLLNEYVGFAVRPDGAIKSGRDLIDKLRKDPTSVSIALSTALAGSNHLATVLALKAAGVDIKRLRIIVVKGAGDAITGVMGGHYDLAAASAASLIPFLESAKLNGIAVSGPKRLSGAFAKVPTWKEQGVDSVYANWRGVMGAKGLSAAQIAYWDGVFAKLAQLPEWREELAHLLQDPVYMNSRETKAYLESQHQDLRAVLVDLGLAK